MRATGERVAILDVDYHHGNGTQQIFWRRGGRAVRLAARRPGPGVPVLPRPGRRDRGGAGCRRRTSTCRYRPARRTSGTSRRSTGRSRRSRRRPGRSSSSRSGFDTYVARPDRRLRADHAGYHEIGRRVAALGRRLVILQEGGYHRPVARRERAGLVAWRRGPILRTGGLLTPPAARGRPPRPPGEHALRCPGHERPARARQADRHRDRDRDRRRAEPARRTDRGLARGRPRRRPATAPSRRP